MILYLSGSQIFTASLKKIQDDLTNMDEGPYFSTTMEPATISEELCQYNSIIKYSSFASAVTSIFINSLLIYFLAKSKLVYRATYFVISHISTFLIFLSIVDLVHMQFICENDLVLDIIKNVNGHILLCLYMLMLFFCSELFLSCYATCQHIIKIMYLVTFALTCYSVSVIWLGDNLFYSVFGFRLLLIVLIFCALIYRVFSSYCNSKLDCTNFMHLALVMSFFMCWLPHSFTETYANRTHVNTTAIIAMVSHGNSWFNLVWLYILDNDFKLHVGKCFGKDSMYGDIVNVSEKV